ncbi:MAG: hypothetical protein FWE11_03080 [Defluviitaleaceae bacterium]|nr:hypothetical protein [Defluviitaleaceae bacterium]
MHIILNLKSDLCAASGHGHAATINTDIVYDQATGLPYVPAKRLKGCLREVGLEIVSARQSEEIATTFYELFGEVGKSDSGMLNISDGQLGYTTGKVPKHSALDALTTLRYSTRMEAPNDELDAIIRKAKDKSLRAARVLNKGETLTFNVESLSGTHLKFLKECCGLLKSMGSNRTRGWGEVECKLDEKPCTAASDEEKCAPEKYIIPFCNDKSLFQASYKITLEDPVISSLLSGGNGCEGHIPGSMLMGCFAGLWIKENPAKDKAHENETFRRIFLEGGVKFGFAYPGNYIPFYPTPTSIKTNKKGDAFFDDANIGYKTDDNLSGKLGGYININEHSEVNIAKPRFEVVMHHARPHDKAKGSPQENEQADSGAFYSYMALASRQVFFGNIVGTKSDLELLFALMPKKSIIRLGRSRTAQYGNASFEWKNDFSRARLSAENITVKKGKDICITARSPMIICDEVGTIAPSADILARKICKNFIVQRSFISEASVAGYNAKWLLPRPQTPAINGGSVIILHNNGDDVTLNKEQFLGLRTGEGFGHVFIEKPLEDGRLRDGTEVSIESTLEEAASARLQGMVDSIEAKREWEQAAIKLAKTLTSDDTKLPSSAQLGRLINVIRKVDSKSALDDKINKDWKDDEKLKLITNLCNNVFALKYDDEKLCDSAWQIYHDCLKTVIRQIRQIKQERRGSDE